jgi:hypothetical protein
MITMIPARANFRERRTLLKTISLSKMKIRVHLECPHSTGGFQDWLKVHIHDSNGSTIYNVYSGLYEI